MELTVSNFRQNYAKSLQISEEKQETIFLSQRNKRKFFLAPIELLKKSILKDYLVQEKSMKHFWDKEPELYSLADLKN